jgi:hypothetical protein
MGDTNQTQDEWDINLSAWIIQDGNYGDFSTGQHAEFALEFFRYDIRLTECKEKSSILKKDWTKGFDLPMYEINAEVIYLSNEVWVVDFGLCAFQETAPPEGLSRGDFVRGGISLGVDPFFYFERLHALPSMPPLIYSWRIKSIRIQTAPFIKKGNVFSRDEDKLGYKTIESTDAWKDDNGAGEYLLTCARLDITPKISSATAITR